ncbi:MAG TPA: hypothetical protein VGS61_02210 [Acidimicrobiales bacterium]|nr:hypothetical protein [Acidimicrobiales bacterium]
MARARGFRSSLYRDARLLGDLQAASRGPLAFTRRYARRRVYASTNGMTRRILRSAGLSR